MTNEWMTPDYIFETSWEVCNKIGGIYTVLSTRAKTLQEALTDRIFFIGPDIWGKKMNPTFAEDTNLLTAWREHAWRVDGLKVRTGRWNVPGYPVVFLVDFRSLFVEKDTIYARMWEDFQVDSLHAYGDYDESCMFAVAAGKVAESFYRFNLTEFANVIFHANEWMTGMGALYIQKHVPEIATVFTTHATTVGRSIACNRKPLYDYLFAYDGDRMAEELNVRSKHSIEKQTAHYADCFTTVSDITDRECKELLDKPADVILRNGFDDSFVAKGKSFDGKRGEARAAVLNLANKLLGVSLDDDTLIVGTSGRYEFYNKGIDVYLEALSRLTKEHDLKKNVLAFIYVPGWVSDPRADLQQRLMSDECFTTPLECPCITHWLHNMEHDQVLAMMKDKGLSNAADSNVKVIFVPCYLDGKDSILNMAYYDVIIGNDLSVYPSYYEPWGYTPLESIAFRVPTLTTDLSGFGRWVDKELGKPGELTDGVKVVHRSDYNYSQVADTIKESVVAFSQLTKNEVRQIRKHAWTLSQKALWKDFIPYYYDAYDIALHKAHLRRVKHKN
ncbi:glycogen/starch synthase [Phocaeicola abscessus]|uniref:glycogen/starch synthase n=1 Tax=Phocaeicola abscessus TaxID=555313 RepID=UPI0028EC4F08|nr:glycogen/starch synthase [Phocaeicola abscessus]